MNNEKFDFRQIFADWHLPYIERKQLADKLRGILNIRTLRNTDSLKIGIPGMTRASAHKIIYKILSIQWKLDIRIIIIWLFWRLLRESQGN